MRNKRTWWGAAAVGIAMIGLLASGCSDRSSGAVGDAVEIPEVQAEDPGQGTEAEPAADPAAAVDEQAAVDDGHDVIVQKIDELFGQLSAEADQNAQLLKTIAELQRSVEELQCQLRIAESAREVRPPRPGSIASSLGRPSVEAVAGRWSSFCNRGDADR